MFINFDTEVDQTQSELTIEPMTLLTRIGGIVGVGKEFLWIIITVCTLGIGVHKNLSFIYCQAIDNGP